MLARDTWRAADELGFAHAWTYDHIVWRDLIGQTWFASVPTLAAAASVTHRIGLGTLVSSPNFRQPVPFAKDVLTLGDIAGGRFILGVGAGAGGADARALGQEEWASRERADRFAEFVDLTRQLLTEPVVDYTGRYYQARQARVAAGQARLPVPLAIAATGLGGMRLAARYAQIWVTNGSSPAPGLIAPEASPELVARQVARLREACAAEGRDPATLRTLLLNVNRAPPALASVDTFRDVAEQYRAAGITDMVVPFPRAEPPFAGNPAVLERVARDVLPELDDW
jgi:alkanesulfonate monooxygenase SsuD/methylene tetrahydromethanopterin reductase-like flavin-dependent oxidoreductase (luciferase family)